MSVKDKSDEGSEITFRQIRAFLAVVAKRSFSNAARELNLTQSTLSRAVSDLERELEVDLFDRQASGLKLTEAGETFLPYARRLAACFEEAIPQSRHYLKSVALAGSNVVMTPLLPSLLRSSSGGDPDGAVVRIHELSSHLVTEHVGTGQADIGLCMLPQVPDSSSCVPLLRAPIGLLTAPGMEAPAKIDDLTSVAHLPFARLSDEMVLVQALRARGVVFDAYYGSSVISNSMPALFGAVTQGRRATLVSAVTSVDARLAGIKFVPLAHLLPPLFLCLVIGPSAEADRASWIERIGDLVHAFGWPDCVERLDWTAPSAGRHRV